MLDVGANIGGLTAAYSRMVGPRGKVYAFEANPRMVPRLQIDLSESGIANAVVVPRAVSDESNRRVKFYCDTSYFAVSSGFANRGDGWEEVQVQTVSLDDFCRRKRLRPALVKIDVEGAEMKVLHGAERLIAKARPVIVVEYKAKHGAEDALAFMAERGYRLFDINLCQEIDKDFYFREHPGHPVVNVLGVPAEKVAQAGYDRIRLEPVARVDVEPGTFDIPNIAVPEAGRYILKIDFDGDWDSTATIRLHKGNEIFNQYSADVGHLLQHPCSHMAVEFDEPCSVDFSLIPETGEPPVLRGVDLVRIRV